MRWEIMKSRNTVPIFPCLSQRSHFISLFWISTFFYLIFGLIGAVRNNEFTKDRSHIPMSESKDVFHFPDLNLKFSDLFLILRRVSNDTKSVCLWYIYFYWWTVSVQFRFWILYNFLVYFNEYFIWVNN